MTHNFLTLYSKIQLGRFCLRYLLFNYGRQHNHATIRVSKETYFRWVEQKFQSPIPLEITTSSWILYDLCQFDVMVNYVRVRKHHTRRSSLYGLDLLKQTQSTLEKTLLLKLEKLSCIFQCIKVCFLNH